MSKIVPGDEVGKIFSIIATLEAGIPIFASPSYANLFAVSISDYPGLIYQFSAIVMTISMAVTVFEELKFKPNPNESAKLPQIE